jgi:hypothetical protein
MPMTNLSQTVTTSLTALVGSQDTSQFLAAAFTQMTLYAQIDERGAVHLVNHLGIRLGDDPEEILDRLEKGNFRAETL